MNGQRLLLSQTQLAEELSECESTCLLSDETFKFGKKFEGFHLSDKQEKLWVLGLRNIITKESSFYDITYTTCSDILFSNSYTHSCVSLVYTLDCSSNRLIDFGRLS
jgi:hypothetical protein